MRRAPEAVILMLAAEVAAVSARGGFFQLRQNSRHLFQVLDD